MTIHTARTAGKRKHDLIAFQGGGCWLYADSLETVRKTVRSDSRVIAEILARHPITQLSFLVAQCKERKGITFFEREYIRYVADVACTEGLAIKLTCRSLNGTIFTAYAAASRNSELAESFEDIMYRLDRHPIVRVKDLSLRLFGDEKGSFHWAKTLLEHLAYLDMVGFNDPWSVSG